MGTTMEDMTVTGTVRSVQYAAKIGEHGTTDVEGSGTWPTSATETKAV